jgi:signal transduction histidine kinase/ActR/RegA family two-component response regulator
VNPTEPEIRSPTSPLESFSRELRRVDTYDQLIELVRRDVSARFGLTNAWLYVCEMEDDPQLVLVATAGTKAAVSREVVPVIPRQGDPLVEALLRDQGVVVIPDAQAGPFPEVTRILGNRTVVNMPMSVVDHQLGILGCGTFDDEGVVDIDQDTTRYLVQLADVASVAVARLVLRKREAARRELERQLAHRQRLEGLGLLAGGVAHDFNNLLLVMRMSAAAVGKGPLTETQRADLDLIQEAERSASKLTEKLLLLGRKQHVATESVDINEVVRAFSELLGRLLPASIKIDFIAGASLPRLQLDAGQVEQVLMNLALNARDAMPNGGRLRIETEQVVVDGEYRRAHPWAKQGRYVLLTVTDTGVGMAPAVIERVFEPFFTTKDIGEGTGLGLAVVWSIVNQHRGVVHCHSAVGLGTAFKVYLPAAEPMASRVGTKVIGAAPRGVERVLIADDQPNVLLVLRRALEGAGYRVTTVANGAAAVEAARSGEFDLYLLDAVMPGLSGRQACERIQELRPTARFLFASGYGAEALPASFLEDMGIAMIPKPMDPDTLLRAVREALDAPPKARG